jgi:hypothetical protein
MNYLHGLALKGEPPVLSPDYVSSQPWGTGVRSVLGTFEIRSSHLPGLASKCSLHDICFMSSSLYRFELPAPSFFTYFISLFGAKVNCYEQIFQRNSSVCPIMFTVSWVQLSWARYLKREGTGNPAVILCSCLTFQCGVPILLLS